MADVVAKKRKTSDKRVLLEFFKDKEKSFLFKKIKKVVDNFFVETGLIFLSAAPLKLVAADAGMPKSFSHAYCRAKNHILAEKSTQFAVVQIQKLFSIGMTILLKYLEDGTLPDDEQKSDALVRLITFLGEDPSKLLLDTETEESRYREKNWCLKLAQHFLSELSPTKKYIIDNGYGRECEDPYDKVVKDRNKLCTCCRKEELLGEFGDTSFGCKTLWHGHADLFFEIPLQFAEAGDTDDDLQSATDSSSSMHVGIVEAKGPDDISQNDMYRMRAQAIVFGFLMHKEEREKDNAQYLLIPHIGFSKKKFIFQFYDSVNDILLQTNSFKLFVADKLNPYVIVLTWLALNYKVLGGETPDYLLQYKSGFHRMFNTVLEKYTEEVEHPCHVSNIPEEDLCYEADGVFGVLV